MDNNFFPATLYHQNIDRFIVGSSILKSIKRVLPEFEGELLDIGCGKMPYKEFILQNVNVSIYTGLDIDEALPYDQSIRANFTWDGKIMPFDKNQFDCAFATEVLEHCPEPEIILTETFRVLKPGSLFFFTVPFLWNLHEVPNDEYRYTPFSLKRHLLNSGFSEIEIYATGGWHLSMAQMLGLWVKRAYIPTFKRRFLLRIILFFMRKLISISNFEKVVFKEGQMITGLYGIARKK